MDTDSEQHNWMQTQSRHEKCTRLQQTALSSGCTIKISNLLLLLFLLHHTLLPLPLPPSSDPPSPPLPPLSDPPPPPSPPLLSVHSPPSSDYLCPLTPLLSDPYVAILLTEVNLTLPKIDLWLKSVNRWKKGSIKLGDERTSFERTFGFFKNNSFILTILKPLIDPKIPHI